MKQQLEPKGIWYSPVSGIWQTVWLEAVNSTHILQVLPTADIHKKTVSLDISVAKAKGGEKVKVELLDEGKVVGTTGAKISLKDRNGSSGGCSLESVFSRNFTI